MAGRGCLHAVAPGKSVRSRPKVALGEALRPWPVDPVSGPPRRFGAFACAGNSRETAKTLWALAGATQRPPLGPGETLPGHQEGRLKASESRGHGGFAMDLKHTTKLLVVKTQAKSLR